MSDPQLRRGIFGYTSKSVGLLLADRTKMFLEVAADARVAEERVAELQAAVQASEEELTAGTEELRIALEAAQSLRSELETIRGDLEEAQATTRLQAELVEKLEGVLGQRDEELETARPAVEERDRLRSRLERITEDLRRQEEHASAQEALAEQLRIELERTQGRLGAVQLEMQAAIRRTEEAEARAGDVEGELASARSELEIASHDLASMRLELDAGEPSSLRPSTQPHPEGVPGATASAEEVSLLLRATEEAMARIIEEAKGRTDEELREAERARAEAQLDTHRLRAWRDRVAPLVGEVRLSVEEARTRATDLRDRVHEVLDPMTDAIVALGVRLEELARAVTTSSESIPDPEVDEDEEPSRVIELREPEVAADGSDGRPSSGHQGDWRPS